MKLIIAGKRTFDIDPSLIEQLRHHFDLRTKEIVSGGARGVDSCGEEFAEIWGVHTIKRFPADWDKHGRGAGHIRNQEMAVYADALLLIWDGESRGSANMKERMLKLKKPIYEVILKSYNVEEEEEL